MIVRSFTGRNESLCYAKSLFDDELSDVVAITWRKHGTGYAVLVEVLTKPLKLDPDGIDEPPGTDPTAGSDARLGSQLGAGGDTTAPLPALSGEPVELTTFLNSEDFRRDQVKAEIVFDRGEYLQRQVTIETKQLSDDQWVRMMLAGRLKLMIVLLVQPIIGTSGIPNRSRVVAVEVVGEKDSPQSELF